MPHKDADKFCEACPNKKSKNGCPSYIPEQAGFMETNTQTGEERFISGCYFQVMPKLMIEVIKASNRPAAAVESMRNEVSSGMGKVFEVITRLPEIQQIQAQMNQKRLENTEETDDE